VEARGSHRAGASWVVGNPSESGSGYVDAHGSKQVVRARQVGADGLGLHIDHSRALR
jgi:hypothetical protein